MEKLLDYFKIPKVISNEEFQVDKEDIKYEYDIIKRDSYYFLFDKDEQPEPFYWIIYDLSNAIKKKYGKIIYAIVECDEDNEITILIGNTYDPYYEPYHAKYELNKDSKKVDINKLESLLNISSQLFNDDDIYVFNVNCNEDIIYNIFKNRNVKLLSKRRLKSLLSKIPVREKPIKKFIPIIWAFILIIVLYSIENYFVKEHNRKVMEQMDQIKRDWIIKIDSKEKEIKKLEKEIKKHITIESMKDKDIYKGIK